MELTEQITAEAEAILAENEHQMDGAETGATENGASAETDESADPGDDEPEEEEAEEGSPESSEEA